MTQEAIKLPRMENKFDKIGLKVTFFPINLTIENHKYEILVKFIAKNVTFNPILSYLDSICGNSIYSNCQFYCRLCHFYVRFVKHKRIG